MRRFSKIRSRIIAFALLLVASVQAAGAVDATGMMSRFSVPQDTINGKAVDVSKMSRKEYAEFLLTQPVDTTRKDSVNIVFSVHTLARAKGDKVLLRWAPDEFAPWYLANRYGYNMCFHSIRVHLERQTFYSSRMGKGNVHRNRIAWC